MLVLVHKNGFQHRSPHGENCKVSTADSQVDSMDILRRAILFVLPSWVSEILIKRSSAANFEDSSTFVENSMSSSKSRVRFSSWCAFKSSDCQSFERTNILFEDNSRLMPSRSSFDTALTRGNNNNRLLERFVSRTLTSGPRVSLSTGFCWISPQ